MSDGALVAESAARRYVVLRPHLDERQRRLLLGVEAAQLGRGGIKAVAEATGVHPDTIARGVREAEGVAEPSARVRVPGGGRKKLAETDPELTVRLKALVDPETRGDPMSLLVWTTKSTRNLAGALTRTGHPVSDRTVARMLRGMGFSLQGNAKVVEGTQHADRDAQFRYLAEQVGEHVATGQPVVSVDTKKKELVGEFKNGGREYQPAGQPERVNVHDFPDKELGKAIPYGIYDVSANTGWVSVGTDHDTSAFAVATLRRWWDTVGRSRYPRAEKLLICADGGGSNGSRVRAWKIELARFASETGVEVTVCHLPPGTSKWNKIEHRLFSQITLNWRGRPLTTHQVVVDLIGNTTTTTGLTVHCVLDTDPYPTGIKYTKKDVDNLPITRHNFHGDWNYTRAEHSVYHHRCVNSRFGVATH
jgi:transposase